MKKFILFLTFCTAALCASASNRYVSPTGSDGDGKSWANAVHTIAQAIWHVGVGDTMFIAEGVYNEAISAQSGCTYMGGYNAETGERDLELYESILDGTGMTSWLLVKYDNPPADPIMIDGLVFQNAKHSTWGAAAMYLRGNMTVQNCTFRNCESGSNAGAIWIEQGNATTPAVVRNCLIENCVCTGAESGVGGIYNNEGTGLIENCIIRGCQGSIGGIRNNEGGVVQNCVLYNNHSTYNGCIYGAGSFFNNTICNNTGVRYAGSRTTGRVTNTVFWGNTSTYEHVNYVDASSGATMNVGDVGTGGGITLGLSANNNDVNGPNFRNPTGFTGLPKTDVEKEAVKRADFSITDASTKLLNQADAASAPTKDIKGVARPKGTGYDIGAYEYDPDEVVIAVTGVTIVPASISIIEGKTGTLVAQIEPANANNKRVTWTIDDPTIATIQNGKVTGVTPGTTTAHVTTQDGNYTAEAEVIITQKPPVKYPQEVLDAEATYLMEDYTIPSYIKFLVPKTAAKIDSLDPDNAELLPTIAGNIVKMNEAISNLQPKQMPYNQIATIYGDPATHMGFCWFTNGGITDGKVQLVAKANATAEDFAGAGVIEVTAQTMDANLHYTPIQASESPKYDICTAAGLPRNTKFDYVSHKAQATTLQPGTVYSWRVGYGEYWSEIAQFVTKDPNQTNFSFLYMSDSHIQDYEYIEEARKCANAVAKNEPDAKFCLFPGDFADTGGDTNSEWQWEQWFDGSMRPALNKMTFVPTDGNHDDSKSLNYDYHFNTDWSFATAASVKPQFKGITYSFVYGDVLFLVYSLQDWWREEGTTESVMHSNYFTNDIRNWFIDQIAQHPEAKYRVTVSHKNVFSGAGHHTDDEATLIRTLMLPILKECEIDLAIQGHDHCYEVIGPVNPDTKTLITSAISGVEEVAVNTNTNMTGKSGGTFVTDEGTLYFIGATCGRKRYYPYSRAKMEAEYTTDPELLFDYSHHNVENLFDLFSSRFGQPGSPSYTRFNVNADGIEAVTYATDGEGNKTEFNTIHVKRTAQHTIPDGIDYVAPVNPREGEKFIQNGQLFILKNGQIYNAIGQKIAQ